MAARSTLSVRITLVSLVAVQQEANPSYSRCRRGEARRRHGCEYTFFSTPPGSPSPKDPYEAGGHGRDMKMAYRFFFLLIQIGYSLCYIVPLILILYFHFPRSAMELIVAACKGSKILVGLVTGHRHCTCKFAVESHATAGRSLQKMRRKKTLN